MIRLHLLIAFTAIGVVTDCSAAASRGSLCAALTAIRPGQRPTVEVSGIYAVDYEHAVLYDPAELSCRMDVQPATWVTFAPDSVVPPELKTLLSRSHRAYVTFAGELSGPQPPAADDPKQSAEISFLRRAGERKRYGHMSAFRTELVVHRVVDVRPVPESVPREIRWQRSDEAPVALLPAPIRPELPRYPEAARKLGITGDVELDVSVTDGVPTPTVRSGDRLLAGAAAASVATWRFAAGVDAKFVTRFTFQLEQRATGADPTPRIELQLPTRVVVTGAEDDW